MPKGDNVDDIAQGGEDLPPPYSFASSSSQQPPPSVFSSHLANLPARILSARAARTSERDEQDSEVLALLVPHMESLIQTISLMEPAPSLMEMTMVPEDAVGEGWKFSDEDQTRRIVRVREVKTKGDVKEKKPVETPREKAFDEWGRWEDDKPSTPKDALWWSDSDMASRLASYLQPERPRPKAEPVVPVPKAPEPKKGGWSLFRKLEITPTPPPPRQAPRVEEDPVAMTVRAEEVTFRRENEMGIWESKTGWGLVVRVRIRR